MKKTERTSDSITNLFHEKLMAYRALSDVLTKERKSIIYAETDKLWAFSSQKQELINQIMQIRNSISETLPDLLKINSDNPEKKPLSVRVLSCLGENYAGRKYLTEIFSAINKEKKIVQSRGAQNISFIHEYLNSVEDIIGIITGHNNQTLYTGFGYKNNNSGYDKKRLYSREV
jgi:flagellar biosynthesis/type III secretory pathway chaperone